MNRRNLYRLWHTVGDGGYKLGERIIKSKHVLYAPFIPPAFIMGTFGLGVILGLLGLPYLFLIVISVALAVLFTVAFIGSVLYITIGMVYDTKMLKEKTAIHQAMVGKEGIEKGDVSYYFSLMPEERKKTVEEWSLVPAPLTRKIQFLLAGYTPLSASLPESENLTVEDLQVNAALNGLPTDLTVAWWK